MLDTTESITMAAVTLITNAFTAVFTSRASANKMRKEGDALISDAIAKRTQQLFDNLSSVVQSQQVEIKSQQIEINGLKASLETCHQQHGEAMRQHNETLRRLEALEAKVVR